MVVSLKKYDIRQFRISALATYSCLFKIEYSSVLNPRQSYDTRVLDVGGRTPTLKDERSRPEAMRRINYTITTESCHEN